MRHKVMLFLFIIFSSSVYAVGKTNYSPVTLLQPTSSGTYITNCSVTKTDDYEQVSACIETSQCGTGKLFFIPITGNENYSAYLSVALASSAASVPVRIVGTGNCLSGYEEVSHIVYTN